MTEAPATTRSRQNTRARLLDAAQQVFAEQGFNAASVETICERAGFTRGAFYSNFESKEQLFMELVWKVCEAKLVEIGERIDTIPHTTGEPLALLDVVRHLVVVAIEQPETVVLMSELRTNALREPRMAEAYLAWQERMAERVGVLIEEIAHRTGATLRVEAIEFARIVLIVWDGTEMSALMRHLPHDELVALIIERTAMLAGALIDAPDVVLQPGQSRA